MSSSKRQSRLMFFNFSTNIIQSKAKVQTTIIFITNYQSLFPPLAISRCISAIRPLQPVMETSAASATSWCSVSTRKPPTRVPYRYIIPFHLAYCDHKDWHKLLNSLLTLVCFSVQLLKGVGTKCWAPDAEYALHSVYQGGLFELRAGDELFVSVSSPNMVNADDSSSYFGAFRLDLWEGGIEGEKKWMDGCWIGRARDNELEPFGVCWLEKGSLRQKCGKLAWSLDPQCLLG